MSVDLFAEAAPPPVQEEKHEPVRTYDHGNVFDAETGERIDQDSVLKYLNWEVMPDAKDFNRASANTVGFKIAQAQRDADEYLENGKKLAAPLLKTAEWLTNTFHDHFLAFGQSNVKKAGSRAKNPGKPTEQYVQLESCRINMGKTGGAVCFDADMYKRWLKGQKQDWLAERGATLKVEIKVADLEQETLDWFFAEHPKTEISLGGLQAVEKLIDKGEPIAGWRKDTENLVGKFRGINK